MRRVGTAILAVILLSGGALRAQTDCEQDVSKSSPLPEKRVRDYTNWFTDADWLTPPHTGLNDSVLDTKKLPPEKKYFCSRSEYDLGDILDRKWSRVWLINPAGDLNTGLCWWHSRFQRAAAYLGNFRPELPKPTPAEAKKIFADLRAMKHVVEIPGYANLADFTYEHKSELTAELSSWQKHDYVLTPTLPKIFTDNSPKSLTPKELRASMDSLYQRMLQKKQIIFQRHKIGGLMTHSWLVTDIQPIRAADFYTLRGYRLKIIDSNFPNKTSIVSYYFGEAAVTYYPPPPMTRKMKEVMLPETDFDDELPALEGAVKAYCAR